MKQLSFLHTLATERQYTLSAEELQLLQTVREAAHAADMVTILLGGKAGRLGECIVATGMLEAILQALRCLQKSGTTVHIVVDEGAAELFDEHLYQLHYWPQIYVTASKQAAEIQRLTRDIQPDTHTLVLDFHGANDGMPYLQIIERQETKAAAPSHITLLGQLFRVGIRSYAQRGPERRYADFIETLFMLSAGTLDASQAQPYLWLSEAERLHASRLLQTYGLPPNSIPVMCFFQSVVPAKCYERWDEVLSQLCNFCVHHLPGRHLTFLLACGPDADLPLGIRRADLQEWLQDFRGVENNASVLFHTTPSLRELAILTSGAALTLANDTGPGHIAGALHIPTITPFLPGTIYSRQVWSSTLWHHGITLEPNPYSFEQLQSAVIWGKTDIIDSIDPTSLANAAISCLPSTLQ